MKNFLLFCLIFVVGCTPSTKPNLPVSSPAPSPNLETISYRQQTYSYAYVVINDFSRLKLLANHSQKTNSVNLVKLHQCQVLVNGNFYDTNDKPLGWLVSNGQTLSSEINSKLFNGFLYLFGSKIIISQFKPEFEVEFGLQSGPLLILDEKPLKLTINQDQSRRRIIAAITPNNQLYFLTFTSAFLADTPEILIAVSRQINQPFLSAINLDGGSASTFYTPQIHLPEYSYIGSFFCYTGSI